MAAGGPDDSSCGLQSNKRIYIDIFLVYFATRDFSGVVKLTGVCMVCGVYPARWRASIRDI